MCVLSACVCVRERLEQYSWYTPKVGFGKVGKSEL